MWRRKIEKPSPTQVTRHHREHKELSKRLETAKLKEYRHWLLQHRSTATAMEKLLTIALDDDHSGQMVALKILSDRVLPISGFTSGNFNSTPSVQINITGYNEPKDVVQIDQEADSEAVQQGFALAEVVD